MAFEGLEEGWEVGGWDWGLGFVGHSAAFTGLGGCA